MNQDPSAGHGNREPSEELDLLAKRVLDAAFAVHRELGPGFGELAYENAMAIELDLLGVPFERQLVIPLRYRGQPIGEGRLDLLVASQLIVELKTVDALGPIHTAQLFAYLAASRLRLGLLLNFNVRRLAMGIRRVIRSAG